MLNSNSIQAICNSLWCKICVHRSENKWLKVMRRYDVRLFPWIFQAYFWAKWWDWFLKKYATSLLVKFWAAEEQQFSIDAISNYFYVTFVFTEVETSGWIWLNEKLWCRVGRAKFILVKCFKLHREPWTKRWLSTNCYWFPTMFDRPFEAPR